MPVFLLKRAPACLTGPGVAGIPGYDFMPRVDYNAVRILVGPPAAFDTRSYACSFSFRNVARTAPSVDVRMLQRGMMTVPFTLDFGSNGFVDVPEEVLRGGGVIGQKVGIGESVLGTGVDTSTVYNSTFVAFGGSLRSSTVPCSATETAIPSSTSRF